ncbi:hypothetical protein SAMN04487947_1192 [Halogeometricum rufum]|uniref:DUF7344 domain-containing protein n=1 Tax=Halogeometricum rufum TaxID=553469 RepID=A0A1I6GI47_9EURY|nr:hypothetical protein [Halogeometricum rufum]SFR41858.1 hypothetical protein SAMN04487947_1192 [Halogeometricum rufum]
MPAEGDETEETAAQQRILAHATRPQAVGVRPHEQLQAMEERAVTDGGTTTAKITADRATVHGVLTSETRAAVIAYLADQPHATVDSVAGFVASRTRRSLDTVRISLVHTHLPRLVEAGACTWDRETEDVNATEQTEAFHEIAQFAAMRLEGEDE